MWSFNILIFSWNVYVDTRFVKKNKTKTEIQCFIFECMCEISVWSVATWPTWPSSTQTACERIYTHKSNCSAFCLGATADDDVSSRATTLVKKGMFMDGLLSLSTVMAVAGHILANKSERHSVVLLGFFITSILLTCRLMLQHHSKRDAPEYKAKKFNALTLLTNTNHIKIFKKKKIWNTSPVQQLAICRTPSPVGFGSGLTFVLHGELVCSDSELLGTVHHVRGPLFSTA